jgi:hypothetical protein
LNRNTDFPLLLLGCHVPDPTARILGLQQGMKRSAAKQVEQDPAACQWPRRWISRYDQTDRKYPSSRLRVVSRREQGSVHNRSV